MLSAPSSARSWLRQAAGLVALAAVVGLAFGLDLGRAHLWDPGEGRYAETVREMLLTHNWIVPTLNFAHYYDKPPGFFWIVAGCFRVFGVTEWAARLPAALSAALTIAATVAFGWRRIGARAALGAGAILATAGEFVVLGRSVRMDMLLALAVSGTLFYAYALWTDDAAPVGEHARETPTWPLYVLPAVGLLIKGPIAIILPLLVLAAFTALTGEYRRLHRLRPGPGLLVALALAGSWYLIAAVRAPDYLWSFLWRQNVDRFFEGASGTGHSEPFWFYFWVLPLTFLPWTLFLPGALRRSVQRARHGHDLDVFLLAWLLIVFVFFTLSRAKLATYLLPIFPALALMVATYLRDVLAAPAVVRARAFAIPTMVWAAAIVALTATIAIGTAVRYPAFGWRAASGLTLLVFPLAGFALARRQRWQTIPVLIAVAALASQMLFYRTGVPIVNEFSSLRAAAEVARALPENARILAYKTRGHSFTFYAGRTLTRVRAPEAVAAALEGEAPVGLLTKAKYLDRIQTHLTEPACVWWQGVSGRVFLANRPFPDTSRHAALIPGTDAAESIVANSPHC
ncbi:MAG: glycosyltransferase family 39 protein [Deltaproteobacteria bacterium]|nr:glycosyltransferase family 39 protein [Deltaproteobacteria bacterium]